MRKGNKSRLTLHFVWLMFFLFVVIVISKERRIDPILQSKIDNFILNEYLPESGSQGLSLSIVQNDGELLYTTGYGWANKEKQIVNGNQTQFLIGSVTKTFTSLLFIKLLNEKFPELGEAVLDKPIRSLLLPNFTLNDRFRSEHVTPRDMLAHRLCLYRDDFFGYAEAVKTAAEVVYRLRYNEEICGFRSEFIYSSQVYTFVGELTGMLAGKPFEEAIQDFMKELGIFNAAFVKRADNFLEMSNRAMPYYLKNDQMHLFNPELVKRSIPVNAASGLFINSNDMTRLLQLHLNGGILDGKQVIPKEVIQWIYKPTTISDEQLIFKNNDDEIITGEYAYGLAMGLSTYDGWEYRQHAGTDPPYQCLLSMFPEFNLGIYSAGNTGPELVEQTILHSFIFETLNGNQEGGKRAWGLHDKIMRDGNKNHLKKNRSKLKSFSKVEELQGHRLIKDIIGEYGSGSSGDLEIVEKWNQNKNQTGLYLLYGKWFQGWLSDVNGNGILFKIEFETDIVQDYYEGGVTEINQYLRVDKDQVIFYDMWEDEYEPVSLPFIKGVSLYNLPEIPWAPESCGPEEK